MEKVLRVLRGTDSGASVPDPEELLQPHIRTRDVDVAIRIAGDCESCGVFPDP